MDDDTREIPGLEELVKEMQAEMDGGATLATAFRNVVNRHKLPEVDERYYKLLNTFTYAIRSGWKEDWPELSPDEMRNLFKQS